MINESSAKYGSQFPKKETKGLPYIQIFSNYEKIFELVETEFLRRADKSREDEAATKEKSYVRFTELEEEDDLDIDEDMGTTSKQLFLHPKKSIREYVDVI